MDTNEQQKEQTNEMPLTPESVQNENQDTPKSNKSPIALVMIAILVAAGVVGGIYFVTKDIDKEVASNVNEVVEPSSTVAEVNNVEIKGSDLNTSIQQITVSAQLQGVDITDPNMQQNIQDQAVTMLVNTELLKQAAVEQGLSVSDEDIDTRLEELVAETGGEAVLAERMQNLGIDDETLRKDIGNELLIQLLLDEIFTEADVTVTEEEVVAFYEQAGGTEAGLPELEEVRGQIEAQVRSTKEQEVLNTYIEELRTDAEIEVSV